MVKFTLEDLSGTTPAMLWPEEFAKFESLVQDDSVVFVKGTMNRTREPAELVINRIIPIDRAAAELSRGVVVTLHKGVHQFEQLERLHRMARKRQGNLDLYFELTNVGRVRRAIYRAGPGMKIRHDDQLVQEFENAVGSGNVRLIGPGGSTPRSPVPPASVSAVSTPAAPFEEESLLLVESADE